MIFAVLFNLTNLVKYLTDGTLVRDCRSKLKALKLSPFLDSEGVVRVGGWL